MTSSNDMPAKIGKTDAEWRAQLTPEQFYVTRQHGTERPFSGPYWNEKAGGIFVWNTDDSGKAFDTSTRYSFSYDVIKAQYPATQVNLTSDQFADYDTMVQLTLDHAHVAEFVVTKVFEHFCFDNPHPALVADMAAVLRDPAHPYELAPFLKKYRDKVWVTSKATDVGGYSRVDHEVSEL